MFVAHRHLDGIDYAVKKVLLTGSPREQERAVREAMCLAKLDHPNVVRYYQVWKQELDDDAAALQEFEDSSDEESLLSSSVADSDSYSYSYSCASASHARRSARGLSSFSLTSTQLDSEEPHRRRAVLHTDQLGREGRRHDGRLGATAGDLGEQRIDPVLGLVGAVVCGTGGLLGGSSLLQDGGRIELRRRRRRLRRRLSRRRLGRTRRPHGRRWRCRHLAIVFTHSGVDAPPGGGANLVRPLFVLGHVHLGGEVR